MFYLLYEIEFNRKLDTTKDRLYSINQRRTFAIKLKLFFYEKTDFYIYYAVFSELYYDIGIEINC